MAFLGFASEDIAKLFIWFLLGVPLVEMVGYLWHRFVEHGGILGEPLRYRHWVHHEREYPAENLRPHRPYQDAKAWSWYVLAAFTFSLLGLLVFADLLPLQYMLTLSAGGVIYARYVVSVFHGLYHVPHHWLHGCRWFEKLTYLHDLHHWERCNYGIVFFWMDRLFGTYRQNKPILPVQVFPGLTDKHSKAR